MEMKSPLYFNKMGIKSALLLLLFSFFTHLSAQVNNPDSRLLSVNSEWNQYPAVKMQLDYFSLTDTLNRDIIHIHEQNLPVEITSLERKPNVNPLNLRFIILENDSAKTFSYIQKLYEAAIANGLPLVSFIGAFNDSALCWNEFGTNLETTGNLRNIFDTVSFKRIFRPGLEAGPHSPDINILITGDLTDRIIEIIKQSSLSNEESGLPFFMLLYRKSKLKDQNIEFSGSKNQLIYSSVFDPSKSNPEVVFEEIDPLLNSTYLLRWESPDPLNLSTQRTIHIQLKEKELDIKAWVPDSILHEYYITSIIQRVDEYNNQKQTENSLILLKNSYYSLSDIQFIEKSEEILTRSAEELLTTKNSLPFTRLTELESLTGMDFSKVYLVEKNKLVDAFYKQLDEANDQPAEQVKIAEYLLQNAHEDKNYQARVHWSKGRLLLLEGKKWNALDEFNSGYALIKDQRSEGEIRKLISICLKEAYSQKDYEKLRKYGSTYNAFVTNDFNLRYLYGKACLELKDYSDAITQFEWLLFHWQENKQVTWDNVFEILQNAYACSFRFNDAIKLNQRIFREKQKQESLFQVVMNLRLMNLKLCMDAYTAWLDGMPPAVIQDKPVDFRPVMIPAFLTWVKLYSENGQPVQSLYQKNQEVKTTEPDFRATVNGPMIHLSKGHTVLLSKISGRRYVSMCLENESLDETEKSLLLDISKNETNNMLWDKLSRHEEKTGLKLFAQLSAALMESSLKANNNIDFEQYWKRISINPTVKYMIFHGPDGTVVFQKGTVPAKEKYIPSDWQKSSTTNAFYNIEIENNGKKITDLSNPVYGLKGREGSVRLGIERRF